MTLHYLRTKLFQLGGGLLASVAFSGCPGPIASGSLLADEVARVVSQQASSAQPIAVAIEQFSADLLTLDRRYRVPLDQAGSAMRATTLRHWLKQLETFDFDGLDRVGQTDYVMLRSEIEYRLDKLELDQQRDLQASKYLPYADQLLTFLKLRENVEPFDPSEIATVLDRTATAVEQLTEAAQPLLPKPLLPVPAQDHQAQASNDESSAVPLAGKPASQPSNIDSKAVTADSSSAAERALTIARLDALRATELQASLIDSLREAHAFYSGYDPLYSWWVSQPLERLLAAIQKHRTVLRENVVGVPDKDQETIIGLPIGADGLQLELRHEWIAHKPAELVQLAERELAWCDAQMALASAELGCGEDWRQSMELVKAKHVQPGGQPQMIRQLAWEAIHFLEAHDLVTVPPLAANGWTMSMMSPERQRVNPYFLGGDSIIVSFPTDAMTHEEKLMSLRSNNEHFARATVHHELIPGHHLQYYMLPRYRPYRKLFATPFWMEGWALYWEMQLWDLDFAHGPEDRVGMLFWRKHRCARIIFSLSYHLGTMSPAECVDYLVHRVGHERSAAAAEVRRSIMGGYSPLYQAAYMLGGLQLRKLHQQRVGEGHMTNRQFHDAVLHEHSVPIEVLRNYLTGTKLTQDMGPTWRFAD
jgi:uncharacterized protein (DUF885 family)